MCSPLFPKFSKRALIGLGEPILKKGDEDDFLDPNIPHKEFGGLWHFLLRNLHTYTNTLAPL